METFTPEELLFSSFTSMSGIYFNTPGHEPDHEPRKITDRCLLGPIYGIARRFQIYSHDRFGQTMIIMRLCNLYFSVEYDWRTDIAKVRWMEDLDFKSMIENEKKIFDKMDTEGKE